MSLMDLLPTVLSGLGGGLLRLIPELIGLWNKKTDNGHELAMLNKQIELETLKGQQRSAEVAQQHDFTMSEAQLTGDINLAMKALDATSAAVAAQMKVTKIWWVDALNFLVRPLTTYYFLGCYGIVKTAMIVIAVQSASPWEAVVQCWNKSDEAIMFALLGFWFVGRTFEKKQ